MTKRQQQTLADLRELIAQNDRDFNHVQQKRQALQAQMDSLLNEIQGPVRIVSIRRAS